jgi:CheY-like chemotaxis protein
VDKLLRSVIGEDIDLRLTLAPGDLLVNADAGQLEQVLMNLATNARDAMQKGGILSIETMAAERESAEPGPGNGKHRTYALISVTDTGIGMEEKTKEKIFEPFFTTKDPGRGTGLGLSMVYGIIKQHHGDIHCYSEPRMGTTFKIYLPLLAGPDAMRQEKAAATPEPGAPRGAETILVAEDDATLRALAKATLEDFGYKVITAVDGKDAVERFLENRNRVRLVLCDVVMPRMSGNEVRDAIRKKKPEARFLFTSGYPAGIIHQKSLLEEGAEILLKPFSPLVLVKKVREALDKT